MLLLLIELIRLHPDHKPSQTLQESPALPALGSFESSIHDGRSTIACTRSTCTACQYRSIGVSARSMCTCKFRCPDPRQSFHHLSCDGLNLDIINLVDLRILGFTEDFVAAWAKNDEFFVKSSYLCLQIRRYCVSHVWRS
jgi:hypothetical protein